MKTDSSFDKTGQVVFMVIGVRGTGSGSLTFPEDFDIVGATLDYDEALALAEEKNVEEGFPEGYDPDGSFDEGEEDEDEECDDEDEDYSDLVHYRVERLDVLTRKK